MLAQLGQSLDPALFWEYRATLLAGLGVNVLVFLAAAALASVLAFAIGLARLSRWRSLQAAATGYAELFRNTPELVIIVWTYYVMPVLLTRALGIRVDFSPWLASVVALGLAYSGFMSETVRAGLLAVPRGHIEAGMSIGMSGWTILHRIMLPQAIRHMLPEALNQFVSLFKATSIVSLIAVQDIMYRVSMINVQEMRPLPLYTGAALLYCAVVIAASQAIQHLSNRRRSWV